MSTNSLSVEIFGLSASCSVVDSGRLAQIPMGSFSKSVSPGYSSLGLRLRTFAMLWLQQSNSVSVGCCLLGTKLQNFGRLRFPNICMSESFFLWVVARLMCLVMRGLSSSGSTPAVSCPLSIGALTYLANTPTCSTLADACTFNYL